MPFFETATGLGYIVESATGRITSKCDYGVVMDKEGKPVSTRRQIADGYQFVEVANHGELADIELRTLDELKNALVTEVKAAARARIASLAPDFKVLRHYEQVSNGFATTLSDAEYKDLLMLRQAIRAASNAIESEINAAVDIPTLKNINVPGHTLWPV